MKAWQETTQICVELERLFAAGQSAALATLFKIEGSSYRRPGAKLLIRADGSMLGQVSGGCLESDLCERAKNMLAGNAPPERVHYDTSADEEMLWGLGLGCDGRLDILLQPLHPAHDAATVGELRTRLGGTEDFSIHTILDGANAGTITLAAPRTTPKSEIVTTGNVRTFEDHLAAPPDLVLIGAGDDAIPLVSLAAEAGFRVTMVDHRSAYLTKTRFPSAHKMIRARPDNVPDSIPRDANTFIIAKNHALLMDKAWATFFAATDVRYIGLLGPTSRRDDIIASLPAAILPRTYGPSGLDIKAEGSEQIAISIVAELLAVYSGRTGGFLRLRKGSIYS